MTILSMCRPGETSVNAPVKNSRIEPAGAVRIPGSETFRLCLHRHGIRGRIHSPYTPSTNVARMFWPTFSVPSRRPPST